MPEGPSIVLLKEATQAFIGKEILNVSGNSKIEQLRLLHQPVVNINTWGKHFLICLPYFFVRIHFLMFGSYLINEKKSQASRLTLEFNDGEINFYSCSVKIMEGKPEETYDFSVDVMNDNWNPENAAKKLDKIGNKLICDALLEQDIFSGVGNIIKNEILYRVKVHPESLVEKIPKTKIKKLIAEARIYSFQFLDWKRNYELKKHWLAHTKTHCNRCDLPIIKKYTGVKNRRSFFCVKCQPLYT